MTTLSRREVLRAGAFATAGAFYGFLALAFVWQLVFFVIARDPVRYRAIMPLGMLEKLGYVISMAILFGTGRVSADALVGPVIDAVWVVLFAVAFVKTAREGE